MATTYIDHIIPESNWERIRDRIFLVLRQAFTDQVYYYQNTVCQGITFWAERSTPISSEENAIIIINSFKGNYDNKSVGSTHGTYTFVLDFMTNSKTTASDTGDKLASHRLQRLLRVTRYILEHPLYITLGFSPPDGGIEHTEVTSWQLYKDDRVNAPADAMNTAIGQLVFTVRAEETTTPLAGLDVGGSDTTVLLDLTDRGFQYGESFTPPLDPRYVYVINQDGELLQMVPGGTQYTVTELRRIIDSFPNNETTIVDDIIP